MSRLFAAVVMVSLVLAVAGCSGFKFKSKSESDSGFFGGDSAPDASGVDFDRIPDAVPRVEPRSKTGNKPYSVFGKTYRPLSSSRGFEQTGVASWYGKKFHGRRTSSGETYDMWAMTAAHPVLPLPTYVEVTNLDTGKKIVVKVNDRGPFLHNRVIDLSFAAAHKLGIAKRGTGRVHVRALDPAGGPKVFEGYAGTTGSGTDGGTVYLIQVGAYRDSKNSLEMRRRIRDNGLQVHPGARDRHLADGSPYRVQVGPFKSLEKALEVKRRLEDWLGQALLLVTR